jgi:2-hydroxy-6-oxonona-2,4-dienedioate hydrolase
VNSQPSAPATLPPIEPQALLPGLTIETRVVAGVTARTTGHGATLLLLHGGTGSWTHWIRNIEALARHFRVVAADLPGMGESLDVPLDCDIDGYGQFMLAAVRGGLVPRDEPFMIAGFSFGAVVTAWLAAQLPQQVSAIALLGPGGFPPDSWTRPPLRPVPDGASEDEANAIHRRNLELMMVGDPRRVDALTVAMQRRNHSMTRFKSRFLGYRDTLGPSLRNAHCPALALLGDRDPLPQPDAQSRADYLVATAPQLTYRIVDDASHWVAFEQPEVVNQALIEFFSAHAVRDAGASG